MWKHLVKYEDVLVTKQADVNKQKEEDDERSKLANSKGLTQRQIYVRFFTKQFLIFFFFQDWIKVSFLCKNLLFKFDKKNF